MKAEQVIADVKSAFLKWEEVTAQLNEPDNNAGHKFEAVLEKYFGQFEYVLDDDDSQCPNPDSVANHLGVASSHIPSVGSGQMTVNQWFGIVTEFANKHYVS